MSLARCLTGRVDLAELGCTEGNDRGGEQPNRMKKTNWKWKCVSWNRNSIFFFTNLHIISMPGTFLLMSIHCLVTICGFPIKHKLQSWITLATDELSRVYIMYSLGWSIYHTLFGVSKKQQPQAPIFYPLSSQPNPSWRNNLFFICKN